MEQELPRTGSAMSKSKRSGASPQASFQSKRFRATAASGHNPSGGLQFLFDIERELNHALHQLFGWQSRKVPEHQLLDIEPHEIPQLERAAARGEDKIAMPVIHDDQIPPSVESRAPQFPGGPFKRVTR